MPTPSQEEITPNQYHLQGGGISVSYYPGGSGPIIEGRGRLRFTYHDSFRTLSFFGDEVHTIDVPNLDTVMSVTIVHTVDTNSTNASLLVPNVVLPAPLPVSINTEHHDPSSVFRGCAWTSATRCVLPDDLDRCRQCREIFLAIWAPPERRDVAAMATNTQLNQTRKWPPLRSSVSSIGARSMTSHPRRIKQESLDQDGAIGGKIGSSTWEKARTKITLLSPREIEVFFLLGIGYSNRNIAIKLRITERTVKAHVARIMAKLGVESRLQAGLVSYAHQLTLQRDVPSQVPRRRA
jgi:DNA-binding CsgD family transcriptional regulator